MLLDPVAFLCFFFSVIYQYECSRICCEDFGCFENKDPFSLFPAPECPTDEAKITFSLYTRSVEDIDITSGNISDAFQLDDQTIFIIHGFASKKSAKWVQTLKDAFLEKDEYNVVVVGWAKLARRSITKPKTRYRQAASSTRVVGQAVAGVAVRLLGRGGDGGFWCVGHSLGAHTCGHAGKVHKWDRVTGLDPAGPLFDDSPPSAGLQPSAGRFVDVIHTQGGKGKFALDSMVFGTLRPMGHVDFYPNGGRRQPGCRLNRKRRSVHAERHPRAISFATKAFTCSHRRAHKYFRESINSQCHFISPCSCTDHADIPASCNKCLSGMCPVNNDTTRTCVEHLETCAVNGTISDCQSMGFHAKREFPGIFYLGTDKESPYCLDAAKTASYINTAASVFRQTCYITVLFSLIPLICARDGM